jgi:hypothetical protein
VLFCFYIKSFNHITQIGDTTAGDSVTKGNRSFLLNVWDFKYPVQLFLQINREYLDRNGGNLPDTHIKSAESDLLANQGSVIENGNSIFM